MKVETISQEIGSWEPGSRQQMRPATASSEAVVTVLFVRLAEIGDPGVEALANPEELAAYQQVIWDVAATYGAIARRLDAGSALLLFPPSRPTEAPSRPAVKAALILRDRLQALNGRRLAEQKTPFRIGIGVHTGAFAPESDEQRERLRALHRCIKDAEGLSLLNRQAPFPAIFVSKRALLGLGHLNGYEIQNLGEVFAPNQAKAVNVYALM